MAFFSNIFKRNNQSIIQPSLIGRNNNVYRGKEKYILFEKAQTLFEEEKYSESFLALFEYLSIHNQHNIEYSNKKGIISFVIFQGSKRIEGEANFKSIKVSCSIVGGVEKNIKLLREILEENYYLEYAKYAINDSNCLCVVYESTVEDASPFTLLKAWEELSTISDSKDDILLNTYADLHPCDTIKYHEIVDKDKRQMYLFLLEKIEYVKNFKNQPPIDIVEFPGAFSFVLLDAIYTLDYLVKSEGVVKDTIAFCNRLYFGDFMMNVEDKNSLIFNKLANLSLLTFEELESEIYDTIHTFGKDLPHGLKQVTELINIHKLEMEWYQNNGYMTIAQSIRGYIIGSLLYRYSFPHDIKEFLSIYYFVREREFAEKILPNETSRLIKSKTLQQIIISLGHSGLRNNDNTKIYNKKINCFDTYAFSQEFMIALEALVNNQIQGD